MKKTLLITLDFPPRIGGVATYLSKMCEYLDPNTLFVLAQREKNAFIFDEQQKYTVYRSPLLYRLIWPRWLKAFFMAKDIVRREGIEQVIISHVVPMGYVALLIGLPFFVVAHGFDIQLAQSNPWKAFWLKKILQKSKGLIANSTYTKNAMVAAGAKTEMIVLAYPCPQFVDDRVDAAKIAQLQSELNLKDKKVLLTVGRLVERKGVDMILHALPGIVEKYPRLRYVVVGDGPYEEKLRSLVAEKHLEQFVIFVGSVPTDDLREYYGIADLFIMPARSLNEVDVEGFGIVYLEANLFGLPVVGGRSGGIPDAVIDNETGILVNPSSIADIQGAVDMILSNPEVAHTLGTQGKARVLSEFTWDRQINKIKNIL